ncbi:hypothetical protein Tco_0959993 [Tanacetum coccineum]
MGLGISFRGIEELRIKFIEEEEERQWWWLRLVGAAVGFVLVCDVWGVTGESGGCGSQQLWSTDTTHVLIQQESTVERMNSSRPSHSPRYAQNLGMAECSNCKFLAERIKTLEARISVLEGQLEMARIREPHTRVSRTIFRDSTKGMRNLNME